DGSQPCASPAGLRRPWAQGGRSTSRLVKKGEDIMAEESQETLRQAMIDREAIRTLAVRYGHCVWQKDVDGYVNLFTEDGSVSTDEPNLPRAQGREGLRQLIRGELDTAKPRPSVQNHVIELLGPDRAKGTCAVEVRLRREGKEWVMTGRCEDEY